MIYPYFKNNYEVTIFLWDIGLPNVDAILLFNTNNNNINISIIND